MRALVTGASGFVGKHLVTHLRETGDRVHRSDTEILDSAALSEEFQRFEPDVVYHLAAQADVGASWTNPAATLRVNVEGTFNVLDAARRAGAARAVAVSSADVYGRLDSGDLPVAETAPLRPVSPYGASKAAAEMVCLQAGALPGLDVVRARAFNHLGPGQSDRFVAAAIASRVAANERSGGSSVRAGNLEARRDFTDVRDVVRAYRLLAVAGNPAEAYNVCSGRSRSIRRLARALLARASHRMDLIADPDLIRPVDVPDVVGDPSKIRADTGWQPQLTLDKTLDDLLEHWRWHTEAMSCAPLQR